MRSAEEVRNRLLERLKGAILRPSMYGGDASGVELLMVNLLADLCYIDEREAEWLKARERLETRGQFGCAGVAGSFLNRVSVKGEFADEVASVYAAEAHRLGLLEVDPALTDAEFRRLCRGLRAVCREKDWRRSEVLDRFGPASVRAGSVLAYVSAGRPGEWVCFDFDRTWRGVRNRDYRLREVRIPARNFVRELTFTPHGRALREKGSGRTDRSEPSTDVK